MARRRGVGRPWRPRWLAPVERRQAVGETGRSAKCEARAQGKVGEGSQRRQRGGPAERQRKGARREDRDERKVLGDLRAKGRGGQRVREPRAGPRGMLLAEGDQVGR